MHFLISQSIKELVQWVEYICKNENTNKRTLQLCYEMIEKTNICLEKIYYKYVLKPQLNEVINHEQIAKSVIAAMIHIETQTKKKDQTKMF